MRTAKLLMRTLPFLLVLLLAPPATGQVVFQNSSIQTSASATTPTCVDSHGAPEVPMASASCAGPVGYSAASSSEAAFTLSADGGSIALSDQAAAATPGEMPPDQSNGTGISSALGNWFLGSDTLYTLVIEGDATFNLSGTGGSNLPPSGTLPTGFYGLSGSAIADAIASDSGPLVASATVSGTAEITFSPVGASDVIMGTVLAGGAPMAGLLVEALDGAAIVKSTRTASDGSYLLTSIPTAVTLRSSDPERKFVSDVSPLLAPPATYDADLAPKAVPMLPTAGALVLATLLLGVAGQAMSCNGGRRGPPIGTGSARQGEHGGRERPEDHAGAGHETPRVGSPTYSPGPDRR